MKSNSFLLTSEQAVSASKLFCYDLAVTNYNEADNADTAESAEMVFRRLKEVLLCRALKIEDTSYFTETLVNMKYPRITNLTEDIVFNNDSVELFEERYLCKSAYNSSYGFDCAEINMNTGFSLQLCMIARALQMNLAPDNFDSEDSSFVLDAFDEWSDFFLEGMDDEELYELEESTMTVVENVQLYRKLKKEGNDISEILKNKVFGYAQEVGMLIESLSRLSVSFNNFLSEEEILDYFPELVANFFGDMFEGERMMFIQSDLPKVYLHPHNYKDTPQKEALIRAAEYLLKPKRDNAPGTGDFSFINENHFVTCFCYGGFPDEAYNVNWIHQNPFWELARHVVNVLLPEVLSQRV